MTQSIDDLVSQAQERFAAAKDAAALENERPASWARMAR